MTAFGMADFSEWRADTATGDHGQSMALNGSAVTAAYSTATAGRAG